MGKPALYRMEGTRLILDRTADGPEVYRSCTPKAGSASGANDSLILDTVDVQVLDTFLVSLVGDTLVLHYAYDTAAMDPDYLYRSKFVRVGRDAGIATLWEEVSYMVKRTGVWQRPLPVEVDRYKYRMDLRHGRFVWSVQPLLSWADDVLLKWNTLSWSGDGAPDSGDYSIVLTKVDANTVLYSGRVSGETVTRKRIRVGTSDPLSGDVQYSSSVASHKTFVEKDVIESCPDVLAWYQQFLAANKRSTSGRVLMGADRAPVGGMIELRR